MDWHLAIEKNREALKRILSMLVAMVAVNRENAPQELAFVSSTASVPPPNSTSAGKGTPRSTLPRHLHRLVLRLLRPAEAATRRLIIVAARGLVVEVPPLRPRKPKPQSIFVRNGLGTGIVLGRTAGAFGRAGRQADAGQQSDTLGADGQQPGGTEAAGRQLSDAAASVPVRPRHLALPLFDPLKRFGARRRYVAASAAPRIRSFDDPRVPVFQPPPAPDPLPLTANDLLDAGRIHRRIEAIGRALDDLPRHAKRLARWQARRDARLAEERGKAEAADLPPRGGDMRQDREGQGGAPQPNSVQPAKNPRTHRFSPMRPGRPPGWRRRSDHQVYDVLIELHSLAVWTSERPDTS